MRGRLVARAKRWITLAGRGLVGRHRVQGRVIGEANAFYCLTIPGLTGPYWPVRGRPAFTGWAIDLTTGRPLPMRATLGGREMARERLDRPDLAAAIRRIAAPEGSDCGLFSADRGGFGLSAIRAEIACPERGWITVFRCLVVGLGKGTPDPSTPDPSTPDPTIPWRYRDWRERDLEEGAGAPPPPVSFSLLVAGGEAAGEEAGKEAGLAATLASLRIQTHPPREVIPVPDASGFAEALAGAGGDFVVPLRAGDILDRRALHHLARALGAAPEADLLYADEETGADEAGAFPVFKPDWSPDTLEAHPYLGAPAAFRTGLARDLPARNAYDLALRFTERTGRVRHLPKILCRRPAGLAPDGEAQALAGRLARTGRAGDIAPVVEGRSAQAVRIAPPSPAPLVSIVIPTAGRRRDGPDGPASLVLGCVAGIRTRSTYARLEIVVVSNVDLEAGTVAALEAQGCRLVACPMPGFNFSTLVNRGVAASRGEYVLLLNDDTDVIAPGWIEALLGQAAKPHVGAAGGLLLYPDGTIQHAGIVTLRGIPHHVRLGFPGEDLGYAFSTAAARNVSAVTGACLMARRALYGELGGFDEAFPNSYNDVDFCFRLRRAGFTVVYEPLCRLHHYESASRDARVSPEETARLLARWPDQARADPYYNSEAFGTAPPAFELCFWKAIISLTHTV